MPAAPRTILAANEELRGRVAARVANPMETLTRTLSSQNPPIDMGTFPILALAQPSVAATGAHQQTFGLASYKLVSKLVCLAPESPLG